MHCCVEEEDMWTFLIGAINKLAQAPYMLHMDIERAGIGQEKQIRGGT